MTIEEVLAKDEKQIFDRKSIQIRPADLSETICAFANADGGTIAVEETGACRDYDDFFNRTRYTVPEGVLDENGRMKAFNNDLVIRYLDRVVVHEDGYEVVFKAGTAVEVRV